MTVAFLVDARHENPYSHFAPESSHTHRMTGTGCHELFAESSNLPAAYGELFLFRHWHKSLPLKTSKQDVRRNGQEGVFISACKYCVFNVKCEFFRHVDQLNLLQVSRMAQIALPFVLLSVITLRAVDRSCQRAQSQSRRCLLKAVVHPGILSFVLGHSLFPQCWMRNNFIRINEI